ncbi:hypothetical protein [Streptomyces sp. NPDC057877]|uniref:hypothetical protein n=1 Tax=Streptomyces sp. NPDC057877 TaxID=3346269 RepID=UPI0036AD04EE
MTLTANDLAVDIPLTLFRDAPLLGVDLAVRREIFGRSALWIPVAVSNERGGRRTIYELTMKQPTMTGIYVVDLHIVKEFLTRTAERSYEQQLVSRDGQVLFSGAGELEVIEERVGYGHITFNGELGQWASVLVGLDPGPAQMRKPWILWSCIQL